MRTIECKPTYYLDYEDAESVATELQEGDLDGWTYTVKNYQSRMAGTISFLVEIRDETNQFVAYWGEITG